MGSIPPNEAVEGGKAVGGAIYSIADKISGKQLLLFDATKIPGVPEVAQSVAASSFLGQLAPYVSGA